MLPGATFGPNGTLVLTPALVEQGTQSLLPAYATLNQQLMREYGAAVNGYSVPQVLGGAHPPGLGFTFGSSWARTQTGIMEFSMPEGQLANQEMALRYAAENSFVGKAMRIKTLLTCRGLSNSTSSDKANAFFDSVNKELNLFKVYRDAVWLYYTVGSATVLLPEDGSMGWLQILDPRMVRTMEAYGQNFAYVVPDKRMLEAASDPKGDNDQRNADYWNSLPPSWKAQLTKMRSSGSLNASNAKMIKLKDGSYLHLQNRFNPIDRKPGEYDGIPLQPYFQACQLYRMGLAAQFAASFLAKNLIALVSVGDPDAEGDNYVRPDDTVNAMYKSVFQTPNQAQWVIGDPTINVRYITPSADAWNEAQLAEAKEALKNLLPSPFWYSVSGGSFADATVEMKPLQQEVDACNDDFDRGFWTPIYERAGDKRAIGKKYMKAPTHDRSAFMDASNDLADKTKLYNNGALDVRSLIEAHGYDPDTVIDRLREQKKMAKEKIFMPPFEQKQNIVAADIYGLQPGGGAGGPGEAGRPTKPGAKPQAEKQTGRQPRPGTGKRGK